MTTLPNAIPHIVDVTVVRGAAADPTRAPGLLIEMPHGATSTHHFDTWLARMVGPMPDGLADFFHVNTDVGSWELGVAVAERLVAEVPTLSVLLVRSLLPRTLVDVNRTVGAVSADLRTGGVTAALPPYVRHEADRALLIDAHRAYTRVAQAAWELVIDGGGLGLIPHTYGPVSLGIAAVDDDIVQNLRAAHVPEVYATWPVRHPVDLITRDGEGRSLAPAGLEEELVERYGALGIHAAVGGTYFLHPSTMGAVWSARWPGRALCLEVRRDLLMTAWTWNQPMVAAPLAVRRFAEPVVAALAPRLR